MTDLDKVYLLLRLEEAVERVKYTAKEAEADLGAILSKDVNDSKYEQVVKTIERIEKFNEELYHDLFVINSVGTDTFGNPINCDGFTEALVRQTEAVAKHHDEQMKDIRYDH